MLNRSLLAAVFVAVLGFATVGLANERATLLLRSGERVSGQLVDMGGVGFTMMVNGTERRIPVSDVVVIDFVGNAKGLPDTEIAAIKGGRHLITMRNGSQRVVGSLYDIGGTSPLQITVNTDAGERKIASSEIGRIYLARPGTNVVATTGVTPTNGLGNQPAAPAGAITVPATQQWTSTGIIVRAGDTVTFASIGEIQLSADNNDIAGNAGARNQRYAANAPLPSALAGALLFRIGNSAAYPLGNQTQVRMPASGELILGINDDHVADNQGQFYVNASKQPGR